MSVSVSQKHSEIIDAGLIRHRDDPTRLMQILRETQETLGWLSLETLTPEEAGSRGA